MQDSALVRFQDATKHHFPLEGPEHDQVELHSEGQPAVAIVHIPAFYGHKIVQGNDETYIVDYFVKVQGLDLLFKCDGGGHAHLPRIYPHAILKPCEHEHEM